MAAFQSTWGYKHSPVNRKRAGRDQVPTRSPSPVTSGSPQGWCDRVEMKQPFRFVGTHTYTTIAHAQAALFWKILQKRKEHEKFKWRQWRYAILIAALCKIVQPKKKVNPFLWMLEEKFIIRFVVTYTDFDKLTMTASNWIYLSNNASNQHY